IQGCSDLYGTFGTGLEQKGDQGGPSGLMRGAHAASGIAVEVLVEQYVVAEVGVRLLDAIVTEHRPATVRAAQEEAGQAARQLFADLAEAQIPAAADWAFHFEVLAIIAVKLVNRLD